MTRSLELPYQPNIVPTDPAELPRWLDVELNKISIALVAQPVAMTVTEEDTQVVGTVVNWNQMFIGEDPSWDIPGGSFDPITGIWTNPQYGLYSMDVQLTVEPYGSGNKNYYAGLQIQRDRGGVITTWETTDGGVDDIPLGVTTAGLQPSEQGDKWSVYMTIVHETFVGSAPYEIHWQILNVSK